MASKGLCVLPNPYFWGKARQPMTVWSARAAAATIQSASYPPAEMANPPRVLQRAVGHQVRGQDDRHHGRRHGKRLGYGRKRR